MTEKYPALLRVLHWVTSLIIIALICVGFYMEGLADDAPNKWDLYGMHKAFGVIALALILIRIPVRLKGPNPPPLATLAPKEVMISKVMHVLLYVAMIGMALSGYLMSSYFPHAEGVSIFGLFTVPDITGKSEEMSGLFHSMHGIFAWALTALIALHFLAVVKHRVLDGGKNDVMPRMM